MAIDKAVVLRTARLARIAMSEESLEPMARELDSILAWVAQLDEVDTAGVEPMTGAVDTVLPQRPDEAARGAPVGDLLANAPETDDGFFVVPKVVE